jgi:hypothetical protein
VLIWRENDPARVNEWLRRADVYEASGFTGQEPDAAPFLSDPRNVCLMSLAGGIFLIWRGPGVYEIHTCFAADARGKKALSTVRMMLEMAKRLHGARLIWGPVPNDRRDVRLFARMAGFKDQGVISTPDGDRILFVMETPSVCRPLSSEQP